MSEFWSALLGGLLALFGVWLTGIIQKNQKEASDRKEEFAVIASIECELLAIEKLMKERHDDVIAGNFGEDDFFRFDHSTSANYLAFFDGNMGNLMKISSQDVRLQVQEFILYGRSYLDSFSSHSQLLNQVVQLEFHCHRHPDDELSKAYLAAATEAIVEFDKALHEQAKDLLERMSKLIKLLKSY